MLGNYKNDNSGNSSSGKSSGTAALAEVKEGAERLAKELDEYLKKSSNSSTSLFGKDGTLNTSGEAVADLQLATARKLREVCFLMETRTKSCFARKACPVLIIITRALLYVSYIIWHDSVIQSTIIVSCCPRIETFSLQRKSEIGFRYC